MNDLGIIDRPDADLTAQAQTSGLSVVSIAKNYDKRSVLSDVSLSVAKGEVVGLLGPNGAGKTTCFYSIMGLVKPDSGRILLAGDDITTLPMYRKDRKSVVSGKSVYVRLDLGGPRIIKTKNIHKKNYL